MPRLRDSTANMKHFTIPFLLGGDVNGIATDLDLPVLVIQVIGLVLLLVNRELIAQILLPALGIVTNHPLFKLLIRIYKQSQVPLKM